MVVSRTTKVITDNEELGFDIGEGAFKMATTSKEGSRRVNYSVPQGEVVTTNTDVFLALAEGAIGMKARQRYGTSSNWRASLVPAAAVIPAPRVYIKAVAIKTLVVYVMVLFVVLCVRPCF